MTKRSGYFSIIPARAVDDNRVGLAGMMVLVALGTYVPKSGWFRVDSAEIAIRVRSTRTVVELQINNLVSLGYLELEPNPANAADRRYRIVYDSVDRTSTT